VWEIRILPKRTKRKKGRKTIKDLAGAIQDLKAG
jgi:hypothetical protein